MEKKIQDQFVTPEIAADLKKLRFNEACFAFYGSKKQLILSQKELYKNQEVGKPYITAPLWQQVVNWFREEHYIDISVYFELEIGYWSYVSSMKTECPITPNIDHKTYYKALTYAIEEAIKIVKKLKEKL